MSVIKSVCYSDTEVLTNIRTLFLEDWFELDPTYSKGNFYTNIPQPKLKFDLNPQLAEVTQANCTNLPLASNSISSIVFDPPFMFGTHGQTKNNIMTKRFTMFDTWPKLCIMYQDSLKEFHRILKKKGILAFKCQDYTDSKTTMTHCLVYQWAKQIGFYPKDIFILIATGGRIYNPKLTQRHARKFHSYWWIFQK